MYSEYDISKQKGSNRWYAHAVGSPNKQEGRLTDKKGALHDAAELMGLTYKDYMDWRRKR